MSSRRCLALHSYSSAGRSICAPCSRTRSRGQVGSAQRCDCHAMAKPLRAWLDENLGSAGTVLGSSPTAAYLAFGDDVVALTARRVPLMPNGATVIESDGFDSFESGAEVRLSTGGVRSAATRLH